VGSLALHVVALVSVAKATTLSTELRILRSLARPGEVEQFSLAREIPRSGPLDKSGAHLRSWKPAFGMRRDARQPISQLLAGDALDSHLVKQPK
jgi:hypothetical protein